MGFFESRMQLGRTMRQHMVRVTFDLDYPYWIEHPAGAEPGLQRTRHAPR
ncbi:MAG: hypothetical protein JNJ92_09050 [Altererythrobacter sp.]|nr:hypothetical protein [Altererythrobacter sp.]